MAPPSDTDPVPPGLTTLRLWASRHGRTLEAVRHKWRKQAGFPDPVGELSSRGRRGGGRGQLLFDEAALDAWLAAQAHLAPPERIDLTALRADPDDRVTLSRFAAMIGKDRKTVTQHRSRPGFPDGDPDGRYRVGDLLQYWNERPGRRTI